MTNISELKIATRNSPLALWQANFIKSELLKSNSALQISLLPLTTEGDRHLDQSLAKIGGKGLFVKELELALLNHKADLAVHSLKDVPMQLNEGLTLAAICEREDPRDAFVSLKYSSLADLPAGSIIGTSSLRRQCQLLAAFPHLVIKSVRGNVHTRLKKLDTQEFDAIILAVAGLKRLNLLELVREYLPIEKSLPAAGQGALAIECRQTDNSLISLLQHLNHQETAICITAERLVSQQLQASCQTPLGSYAEVKNGQLILRACLANPANNRLLQATAQGIPQQVTEIAHSVVYQLLEQGAQKILTALQNNT